MHSVGLSGHAKNLTPLKSNMKDVRNFPPRLVMSEDKKEKQFQFRQFQCHGIANGDRGNHGQRMRVSPVWCRDVVSVLISDDIPSVIWLLSA